MVKKLRPDKILGAAGGGCLALCLIAFTASSWATPAPIYKCLDKNLSLVYTDVPCKGGEQLDIRPGEADPAALAGLERDRDALDQSAGEQAAQERRAVGGEAALLPGYEADDQAEGYDYGYGIISYWLRDYYPMHPRKPKVRHVRHLAPPPPYVVPRP
jgi:hypothetical protein